MESRQQELTPVRIPQLTDLHVFLIELMQAWGCQDKDVKGGVCHGGTTFLIDYCFTPEGIVKLNQFINLFMSYKENLLTTAKNLRKKLSQPIINTTSNNEMEQMEVDNFVEMLQEQRFINDIVPQLKTIFIYQNPGAHKKDFNGYNFTQLKFNEITWLANSHLIAQHGGMMGLNCWAGVYSESDLNEYLNLLDSLCEKHNIENFSFLVVGMGHTFGIVRNPGGWYLADMDRMHLEEKIQTQGLPSYYEFAPLSIEQLSFLILSGFPMIDLVSNTFVIDPVTNLPFIDSKVGFNTKILIMKNEEKKVQNMIIDLFAHQIFKKLHEVTIEKLSWIGKSGITLLELILRGDDIQALDEVIAIAPHLLEQPLPTNQMPIHVASGYDNSKAVETMHENAGISVHKKDCEGFFTIHLACKYDFNNIATFLIEESTDKITHAIVNQFAQGWHPIDICAYFGSINTLKLLLEHGAWLTHPSNFDKKLAIHFAAEQGHLKAVNILIDAGADKNCGTEFYETPLFIAARNGHMEVVSYLLGLDKINVTKSARYSLEKFREFAKQYNIESKTVEDFILKKIFKNPSHKNINVTPAEIAELMGHKEIASRLKNSQNAQPMKKLAKQLEFFSHPLQFPPIPKRAMKGVNEGNVKRSKMEIDLLEGYKPNSPSA